MRESYKERVAAEVLAITQGAGKKMSQADLAKLAGVNDAYISSIKNRKWDNHSGGNPVPDRVFQALALALGIEHDTLETVAYNLITERLYKSKANHHCGIIDAPKGTGKTHTQGAFKKECPAETYYVKLSGDMTAWHFMVELAKQCGAKPDTKIPGLYDLRKAVVAKLLRDSEPIVLIDEGENIIKKPALFDVLKSLYDDTEDRVSIQLVGANNLYRTLRTMAKVEKPTSCIPQFMDRFGSDPLIIEGITSSDKTLILDHFGIQDKEDRKQLAAAAETARWLFKTLRYRKNDAALLEEAKAALKGKEEANA